MKRYIIATTLLLFILPLTAGNDQKASDTKHYYCEYCGYKFPSVHQLTHSLCSRHPDGINKGYHKLYEGTEKSEYTCKYCGRTFPTIMLTTAAPCSRHPKGPNKGNHSPAL